MKKTLFVVFSLFILLSASVAQINLSFNPSKGAKYRYNSETSQEIKQTVNGQEIPVTIKMDCSYDMTIEDKINDDTKVSFVYKRFVYDILASQMNIKFDSENPTDASSDIEKTLSKMMNCILEKQFDMVISLDGSVKLVTGIDEISQEMTAAIADSNPASQQMVEAMKKQFSNDAIRKSFEQSMKIYPEKKINIGESWEIKQSNQLMGMVLMDTNSTYRLTSTTKKDALLNVESTFSLDVMQSVLSGKQNGTVELDLKTGVINTSEIIQRLGGNIKAGNVEMPMSIVSKIKITTEKLK